MRVTITKTIDLGEIPSEIEKSLKAISERLAGLQNNLHAAASDAKEGKYVNAAEELEALRTLLVLLDKNIEEQQSLCLSYEKIRIAKQMPDSQPSAPPNLGEMD